MFNSKAYYKLTGERHRLTDLLDSYKLDELQEVAKRLKKGSQERKDANDNISNIKSSAEYKVLQEKIKSMNFCINNVFYLNS